MKNDELWRNTLEIFRFFVFNNEEKYRQFKPMT